jgi:tRNA threonylcarbamoyladenosine modification (KEOPS) complex  Pcc1 subunit
MSERSADTVYKAVEEEVRKVMAYASGTRA